MALAENKDLKTVDGFGDEWSRFPQDALDEATRAQIFQDYFDIFPWDKLPEKAVGADIGCGSGRWAQVVAPRVGALALVDASDNALNVARCNLSNSKNTKFHHASVDALPFEAASLDFAYSLGVLHHVPETAEAIKSVSTVLKKGAPFLIYLYYSFDNRGLAYRLMWRMSDLLRFVVCRMPHSLRYVVSQIIAGAIYWPLARLAKLLDRFSILPSSWPLAYYRDKPFYVLRTDALDRFGTRLEQRFSKQEIHDMLEEAGFKDIVFSDHVPFWCAVAFKG